MIISNFFVLYFYVNSSEFNKWKINGNRLVSGIRNILPAATHKRVFGKLTCTVFQSARKSKKHRRLYRNI
ncbi:unnamed protein product [Caenorhabditis brenneri]